MIRTLRLLRPDSLRSLLKLLVGGLIWAAALLPIGLWLCGVLG